MHEVTAMARTNIILDDKLVKQGLQIYKCKSKRELVHLALNELLKKAKRREILDLRGKVKWEGDLREMRRSRYKDR
jgi:Arc/MetJ family transcription regulator